jgi:hypothetical protein
MLGFKQQILVEILLFFVISELTVWTCPVWFAATNALWFMLYGSKNNFAQISSSPLPCIVILHLFLVRHFSFNCLCLSNWNYSIFLQPKLAVFYQTNYIEMCLSEQKENLWTIQHSTVNQSFQMNVFIYFVPCTLQCSEFNYSWVPYSWCWWPNNSSKVRAALMKVSNRSSWLVAWTCMFTVVLSSCT